MKTSELLERYANGERSFVGVDLPLAQLRNCWLPGIDLSKANLYGADLAESNLAGAKFCGADLNTANLFWSNLSDADLSGASLIEANLACTRLSNANMANVNLQGANLARASGSPLQPYCRLDFNGWPVCVYPTATQIGCAKKPNSFWLHADSNTAELVALSCYAREWWAAYGEAVKSCIRAVIACAASRSDRT